MSSYGNEFTSRNTRPAVSHAEFALDRRNTYPVGRDYDGHGFPPPSMTGGYDAKAAWDDVKIAQKRNKDARDDYNGSRRDAGRTVESMAAEESRYYKTFTAGVIPTDHGILKPMARTHQEAAYEHGAQREALLRGAPMLYDTVESQRVHYDNTEGHFRESDRAEAAYRLHQRFENDPDCTELDAYGRPIPRRRRPAAQSNSYAHYGGGASTNADRGRRRR